MPALKPHDLLKHKETLRSPSSICNPVCRRFQPLHLPLLTHQLSPIQEMGFYAQARVKAEAVIACGWWCRMCPSPCALANLHPLACRLAATRPRYTNPQVGTSHIWKVRKKSSWEISEDLYNYIPQDVGLITQEATSFFLWVSTEQVIGLSHHL